MVLSQSYESLEFTGGDHVVERLGVYKDGVIMMTVCVLLW